LTESSPLQGSFSKNADLAVDRAPAPYRKSLRENALSDENRVCPEHFRTVLQEFGRGSVHEESDKVVAFGIADQAHQYIWALFVAPGFEGQGIGSELLEVMVEWLFEQSREPVWLTTGRNTRAEHFYSAAGWRAMGSAANGEIRFELSAGDAPGTITRD
jgi:GNAT superfamily N-acetyltransferase